MSKMNRKDVTVLILWNVIISNVDTCTFPAILEGKTWEDSDKGRPITFSGSGLSGWTVTFGAETISSWTCLFNQNNLIVFKSSYQFFLPPFPPQTKHVYVCMWTVSVEADRIIYYLLADEDVDSNTRLFVSDDSSLGACDVCKLDLSLDTSQGKAMVTSGSPSSVPIPAQSGPCSGCSCTPTTEASTTTILSTSSEASTTTEITTTTSSTTSSTTATSSTTSSSTTTTSTTTTAASTESMTSTEPVLSNTSKTSSAGNQSYTGSNSNDNNSAVLYTAIIIPSVLAIVLIAIIIVVAIKSKKTSNTITSLSPE